MRGTLLIWIGLMGLAGTAAAHALLRLFPRAFSESGPAVAWPWQRPQHRSARVRGWILVTAAIMSVFIAVAGIASFLP
jgi:hypothetical protein